MAQCLPDVVPANLTEDEIDEIRKCLSEVSFYHRQPVVGYLSSLIIIGLFGNVVVLLVYVLRIKQNVIGVFIRAIAVCDLLTSVVGLPMQLAAIHSAYNTYDKRFCRFMFVASIFPTEASGLLLVMIAIERYRRISRATSQVITVRQAWGMVFISVLTASSAFSFFVPLYGIHSKTEGNVTVKMCWVDDEYVGTLYDVVIYRIVLAVFFLVGLVAMVSAYSFLAEKFIRQSRLNRCRVVSVTTSSNETPEQAMPRRISFLITRQRRREEVQGKALNVPKITMKRPEPVDYRGCPMPVRPIIIIGPMSTISEITEESKSVPRKLDKSDDLTQSEGSPSSHTIDSKLFSIFGSKSSLHSKRAAARKTTPITEEAEQLEETNDNNNATAGEDTTVGQTFPTVRRHISQDSIRPRQHSTGVAGVVSVAAAPSNTSPRVSQQEEEAPPISTRVSSRTTRMMTILTVLYIANWLPHLIARVVERDPVNWCDEFTKCEKHNLYAFALRSYFMNSAVNAFVYSFFNPAFRRHCRELFKSGWSRLCRCCPWTQERETELG